MNAVLPQLVERTPDEQRAAFADVLKSVGHSLDLADNPHVGLLRGLKCCPEQSGEMAVMTSPDGKARVFHWPKQFSPDDAVDFLHNWVKRGGEPETMMVGQTLRGLGRRLVEAFSVDRETA